MPAAIALAAIEGSGFLEAFDGNPAAPQPWRPTDWDVTVHSRDTQTWQTLEPMDAHHGADCGAPPATHRTSSYEGAVFLCRDHVMTAINAAGYGLIYLTPPAMADWSGGESVVRFDMSTLRTSPRDWVDVWVFPYEDTLQLALDDWIPDGNGLPRRALHLRMDNGTGGSIFRVERIEDFQNVWAYDGPKPELERELAQRGLATSASRRDTFELRVRPGHVSFTMPQYGITFADAAVPGLDWTRGVVTLGHHSYNPTKDCSPSGTMTCLPDSWHWDNVSIVPKLPFTIIRADRRALGGPATTGTFALAAPAPQDAHLRFSGIGTALSVSFDGGATWRAPVAQAGNKPAPPGSEHFQSYRMPIPAGTTRVVVRGQAWFAGPWQVKDVSVWAQSAQEEVPPSATTIPTSTGTPTSVPTAAPSPTATPTVVFPTATSSPTVARATPTPIPDVATPASPTVTASPTPVGIPWNLPPEATVVCLAGSLEDGRFVCDKPTLVTLGP